MHRNALRLLKLVNTLLDFSRIEAGRLEAAYEPTDLAALTRELASDFRSAIERAGLRLELDVEALPEPVFVDRDMWEKIVLNLLSNALKFTFEGGEIAVRAPPRGGDRGACSPSATPGSGWPRTSCRTSSIASTASPGARSRTHEGTGIGLSWSRSWCACTAGR